MGEIGFFRTGMASKRHKYDFGADAYEEYMELLKVKIAYLFGLELNEHEQQLLQRILDFERIDATKRLP